MTKTCPACNSQVDARRVNCPTCNRRLVGGVKRRAVDASGSDANQKSKWLERALIGGLVLLSSGILFCLLLPATNAPCSSKRSSSKNTIKQLGIGLENYEEHYQSLPSSGGDEGNRAVDSWMTLLLPQADQMPLFNQINISVPFDHPRNAGLFRTPVAGYINPASERAPDPLWFARTDYTANEKVLGRHVRLRFEDVTDGLSNTVLAGEIRDNAPPWGSPDNSRDLILGVNRSPHGFGSPHQGGAYLLMADGAVRWIPDTISIEILSKLAHPTDGLEVGDF